MKVLVVDDERALREILDSQMKRAEIEVITVASGEDALEQLHKTEFDVVVTDLRLPGIDGIEVIKQARATGNEVPFLLITAYASVKTAVSALKAGAADYLIKPVRVPDLIHRVKQLYDYDRLRRENALLKRIVRQDTSSPWLPDTPAGHRVNELLSKVADTDMTVIILGESGTGKGMVARLLHNIGPRREAPFVSVNCSAIPETLVESELFGHIKGAFTGTNKNQDGLFVAASGGTLFLDEIGEISLAIQAKLLHAIEDKTVRAVGASKDRHIAVRIIVATNRNLEDMIKDKTFREDLYYRLNIFQIPLPALRDEKEALPSAAEYFLAKHTHRHKHGEAVIDEEVWKRFYDYGWPGNLRELDNVIERALLLSEDGHIKLGDLPPNMSGGVDGLSGDEVGADAGTLRDQLAAFEHGIILRAIDAADGDRNRAAKSLGIGLSTLYRKAESFWPK